MFPNGFYCPRLSPAIKSKENLPQIDDFFKNIFKKLVIQDGFCHIKYHGKFEKSPKNLLQNGKSVAKATPNMI